jgi:hypothetical protein
MESHDRGTTIRNPATANLLIDSIDRPVTQQSGNFTINKKYSILNGFFTRMAVTEAVVDWCVDNISEITANNTFTVSIGGTLTTVTFEDGSYTVATLLDQLVVLLNTAEGQGQTFSIIAPGGAGGFIGAAALASTGTFTILESNLQNELNIVANTAGTVFPVSCPVLLPYTYIDFVCSDLTYNQSLKDTTTNSFETNVLYRWYFAWEGPAPVDAYGYPIYQGYQRFIARRSIAFPKQIRWENNMPIGQLSFQVYSSQGVLLAPTQTANGEFEWKLTLLVSEN